MWFELAIGTAAVLAGVVASVAGFGIGSLLTPLLALKLGTKLAVAAVSIPHVIGTAIRFWLFRGRVDRRIFLWFGLASAAGGLAGALLHAEASNRALGIVLGGLLVFVGVSELSGVMRHVRFGRRAAWVAGAVSGAFGGLVGNQGGIRSAALLAFEGDKETFVATATAVGLVVDAARMPVYLATEWTALHARWPVIALATSGVVAGTLAGRRLLAHVPEPVFRRVVSVLLLTLGAWMILHGCRPFPPCART
jgi:uncharacterized membrane protein YfcA